jgi:hypothetical protein
MPRYFIDLRDRAGLVRDEEGSIYSHIEDALDEAKASARDLVQQYMDNRIPLGTSCVEVRDVQGRTVATVTVAEVLEHPVHPAFKNKCSDDAKPRHH